LPFLGLLQKKKEFKPVVADVQRQAYEEGFNRK